MSLVAKVKDTSKLSFLPRVPISDSGETEPKTIIFSQHYFGVCLDLMIENRDTTNSLKIKINRQKEYELGAGATKKFENMVIDEIQIIPHPTTGNWYLDAGIVDYWLFKKVAM